jgi:hypothetical protein
MLRRRELDTMAQDVLATVVARLWELRTAVLQTREAESAVIRHLNAQLAAVLNRLHKLDVRDSDLDPTIAIKGRVQQYEALREALEVFDDILGAIRTWHGAQGVGNGVPHYWLAALIPHPRTVDPLVGAALSNCYAWNPTSGETYEGTAAVCWSGSLSTPSWSAFCPPSSSGVRVMPNSGRPRPTLSAPRVGRCACASCETGASPSA